MSSQKGNMSRTRPQKYKNRSVFKNNLHDKSVQTKRINSTQVSDVCIRCKEIIEWKIKYKKYKPLTQPKTCVKCGMKTVKQAYHVMCRECGHKLGLCTKCCQSKEIIELPSKEDKGQLDNDMKLILQSLPERKRRTFIRYMNKREKNEETTAVSEEKFKDSDETKKSELMKKLQELKVGIDDDGLDLDESDFDDESFGEDEYNSS